MEINKTLDLKELLEKFEKYNQNFTHYFACLTTANYEIKTLGSHFKRIANIRMNKTRSKKATEHIEKLLRDGMKSNSYIIQALETEIDNLTQIVNYLAEQKPKMDVLIEAITKAKNNFTSADVRKDAVKFAANAKKLNNNIDLCNNYILPKNKAILEERKGLQNRLQFKYSSLQYSAFINENNNSSIR